MSKRYRKLIPYLPFAMLAAAAAVAAWHIATSR